MATPPKSVLDDPDVATPHNPDGPMTGDQADLLRVLCENAGEPFDASLTQAQALARIEVLRKQLNEGQNL
ncbi:DUF3072 domain-containing protein [Yoonia sp. 2307UL14-13]|uniref:DUF3072 domain-containing protein n=1 Tax=Yoonia sp. 2307UL14-13 TaxID=3126506 RepID=UPI0030976EF9